MQYKKLLQQSLLWRGLYFVTLFALNVVISRVFEAKGSGEIFYLSAIFGFCVLVLGLGLEGGFTFFASNKSINTSTLAITAIIWVFVVLIIINLLIPFLWHFLEIKFISDSDKNRYAMYYIVGVLLTNFFISLYYSKGNYFLPNTVLSIVNIALIFLIFFSIYTNSISDKLVHDYFLFNLIGGVIVAIIFWVKYNVSCEFNLLSLHHSKHLIKYSLTGFLANIIFYIVYKLDFVFVQMWCSSAHLGNYIQASKFIQLLLIVPQIIASTIFPQTASGMNKDAILKNIYKLSKTFFWAFIVIFLFFSILGNITFKFLFGASFSEMNIPFIILLPGIFGLSISTLLSAYFNGKKQNKLNVYAALIAIFIMALGTFILKQHYTIGVAASISSVAYIGEAWFCIVKFCKMEGFSIKQLVLNIVAKTPKPL